MAHPTVSSQQRIGSMYHGEEAGSQTYVKGNLVYLAVADGDVTECASDATLIFGIAEENASGTENTAARVRPIYVGDEVEFDVYDTSDAARVSVTNLIPGVAYGVVLASSVFYIDNDETTADAFVYLRPARDNHSDGTSYRGVFQILPTVAQTHVGGAPS